MMMVVAPIMTVMPIATNPEDAVDGTHRAADTGADRAANDGAHPGRAGYQAVADLIDRWPPWRAWLP